MTSVRVITIVVPVPAPNQGYLFSLKHLAMFVYANRNIPSSVIEISTQKPSIMSNQPHSPMIKPNKCPAINSPDDDDGTGAHLVKDVNELQGTKTIYG